MRINQSYAKKQKIYTLDTIKGVDTTSLPLKVKKNRASYMLNMINEGGVNRKRNGWKEICRLEDENDKPLRINGIYEYREYTDEGETTSLVVHAGKSFYKCNTDFSVCNKIGIQGACTVKDQRSQGFFKNKKLWIVGAGDYLVYDGKKIMAVKNSEHAYIPTTSIGITDRDNGANSTSFEGVNLFTKRRKNKLVGSGTGTSFYLDGKINLDDIVEVKAEMELGGEDTNQDNLAKTRYYFENDSVLLGSIDAIISSTEQDDLSALNGLLTVNGVSGEYKSSEIKIVLKKPVIVERLEVTPYSGKKLPTFCFVKTNGERIIVDDYTDTTVGITISQINKNAISEIYVYSRKPSDNLTTNDDNLKLGKMQIQGTKLYTGNVSLEYFLEKSPSLSNQSKSTTPVVRNEDGEEVKLYEYNVDLIAYSFENRGKGEVHFGSPIPSATLGEDNIEVTYTADYEQADVCLNCVCEHSVSAGESVLFVGKDNLVYFGTVGKDYGYIADNCYIALGSDKESITSLASSQEGVCAFKRSESYLVDIDAKGSDEDGVVLVPSVKRYYQDFGCEGHFTQASLNGDLLAFTSTGVMGVASSSNIGFYLRSDTIQEDLKKYSAEQVKNGFACVHDGRYYLFIEGKVYIADSRFKCYESNRLDTSFSYEWWVWDNCPGTCALSLDSKLIIGKENGAVAIFGQEYSDRSSVKVKEGELVYNNGLFTFSPTIGAYSVTVENGDEVSISGALEIISKSKTCQYEGEYLLIDTNAGDIYRNTDKDPTSWESRLYLGMRLVLYNEESYLECPVEIVGITEDYKLKATCLSRIKIDTTRTYDLCAQATKYTVTEARGAQGKLCDKYGNLVEFRAYESISATIERNKSVSCEFHTAMVDFGTNIYTKTLQKIVVVPTADTAGEIELGYETNRSIEYKKRQVGEGLDFDELDFNSFSFDSSFVKSYIKRVFERNFNYIVFRFASHSNKPFGIQEMSCSYIINNELRGDR
ncbi:MAG: hypothetical protein IJA82_02740 [Clostridia bacterium]|nr:hypothetical protein [Clostridia bacterium]